MVGLAVLVACGLGAPPIVTPLATLRGYEDICVDAYERVSPSGRWRAEVEPLEWGGIGPMVVRLWHDGESVAQTRVPFTLGAAELTDGGYLVGCGTTRRAPFYGGEYVIGAVGPDGRVALEERIERMVFCYLSGPSTKLFALLIDPEGHWFSVQLLRDHTHCEEWRYHIEHRMLRQVIEFDGDEPEFHTEQIGPPEQDRVLPRIQLPLDGPTAIEHRGFCGPRLVEQPAIEIDARGRTWVYDRSTADLQGFDMNGEPVFEARIGGDGSLDRRYCPDVTARPDGGLLVEFSEDEVLRIDSLGRVAAATPATPRPMLAELPGDRFLTAGSFGRACIVDSDRNVMQHLDRLADGRWVRPPLHGCRAADGRLALLLGREVAVFDPHARPVETITLPQHLPDDFRRARVSMAGDRVLVHAFHVLLWLYCCRTGVWSEIRLPTNEAPPAAIGLTPDGRRLIAAPRSGEGILLYALPE